MTQSTFTTVFISGLVILCCESTAWSQLFGQRQFGRPLSRRIGPRLESAVGTIGGAERFVRGNRDVTEFVGSNGTESAGFVGLSSTGRRSIRSAADGIREPTPPRTSLNRPLPRPNSGGMYYPRLSIDQQHDDREVSVTSETLTRQLSGFAEQYPGATIEVSVEGRTAILRGEVASVSDRNLIQRIVEFDPAVQLVRNELRVALPRADSEPARLGSSADQVP